MPTVICSIEVLVSVVASVRSVVSGRVRSATVTVVGVVTLGLDGALELASIAAGCNWVIVLEIVEIVVGFECTFVLVLLFLACLTYLVAAVGVVVGSPVRRHFAVGLVMLTSLHQGSVVSALAVIAKRQFSSMIYKCILLVSYKVNLASMRKGGCVDGKS